MKFYNREKELKKISEIIWSDYSEFIYIYWRRRIGKTTLIKKALENEWKKYLYFFIEKKTRFEILDDFRGILLENWYEVFWRFQNYNDFLSVLFQIKDIIIVFDEFQNFYNIDGSFYSAMQNYWDTNKNSYKYKFFFIGSMFTLMKKIFENYNEPLFWRKTWEIKLDNFSLITQKEILIDLWIFSDINLLKYFSIFNWIPKYLEILFRFNKLSSNNLLNQIIYKDSFFLNEWKNILIEEFWKNYSSYFSILTAISFWKTKKNEIENFTWINIDSLWRYLQDLEQYYELIERKIPIFHKKHTSKLSRYEVKDLFLKFWFRYIYKKKNLIEIEKFDVLIDLIENDLHNFLWYSFEKLVKELLVEENRKQNSNFFFTEIWASWDRQNYEIDIVTYDEINKKACVIECKLSESKINDDLCEKLLTNSNKVREIFNIDKEIYIFTPEKISVEKEKLIKKYNIKNLYISMFL